MRVIRILLRDHRRCSALLLALALCLKVLVPAGYMPTPGAAFVSVEICGEGAAGHGERAIAIPLRDALSGVVGDHGQQSHQTDQTCPYAALGHAALGGADAPLLAIALALAMLLALLPLGPVLVRRASHLRPPLRGPPASA